MNRKKYWLYNRKTTNESDRYTIKSIIRQWGGSRWNSGLLFGFKVFKPTIDPALRLALSGLRIKRIAVTFGLLVWKPRNAIIAHIKHLFLYQLLADGPNLREEVIRQCKVAQIGQLANPLGYWAAELVMAQVQDFNHGQTGKRVGYRAGQLVKRRSRAEIFRQGLQEIVVVNEEDVDVESEHLRRHRAGELVESEVEECQIRCAEDVVRELAVVAIVAEIKLVEIRKLGDVFRDFAFESVGIRVENGDVRHDGAMESCVIAYIRPVPIFGNVHRIMLDFLLELLNFGRRSCRGTAAAADNDAAADDDFECFSWFSKTGRRISNSNIFDKELKSASDEPPGSTAFLAIFPKAIARPLLSSASSPIISSFTAASMFSRLMGALLSVLLVHA
nr:hypothetical protein TorRG33x02_161300 [Ipomoea batatas]